MASDLVKTPNRREFYRLGMELNRLIGDEPVVLEYHEIASRVGISKQNAYLLTMVALGKFAWFARQRAELNPLA